MSFEPLSPGVRDALFTIETLAKAVPAVVDAFRAIIGGHPEAERVRDVLGVESPVKGALAEVRAQVQATKGAP